MLWHLAGNECSGMVTAQDTDSVRQQLPQQPESLPNVADDASPYRDMIPSPQCIRVIRPQDADLVRQQLLG